MKQVLIGGKAWERRIRTLQGPQRITQEDAWTIGCSLLILALAVAGFLFFLPAVWP